MAEQVEVHVDYPNLTIKVTFTFPDGTTKVEYHQGALEVQRCVHFARRHRYAIELESV